MCIKWCGAGINRLFTGSVDKCLHAYDLGSPNTSDCKNMHWIKQTESKTAEEIKGDKEGNIIGHSGFIMDLLPIPDKDLIATASLDSNICTWSMTTMQGYRIHKKQKKAIYSLDWCEDPYRLILSAGLDHDIYIWNPSVPGNIFSLRGHNHSLTGVKWLRGTHQIVSADISGMFRIWDVRTFTTVQTFNCPLNEINCFAVTSPPKRVVAGGRRLVFYDYNEPKNNHLADDQACLFILYNPVFYTFITAHPKCIKIWDATNGTL